VFENTGTDQGSGGHMPVGQKTPNAWGIHDMLGNVSEWCRDRSGPLSSQLTIDPKGPETGKYRVVRGGNCFADAGERRTMGYCMAGTRARAQQESNDRIRGFRIVLVPRP
jgi:sulfatase modifying factor 1